MSGKSEKVLHAECIERRGPWPFITRRIHRDARGALKVWRSRHHRKALASPEAVKTRAMLETLLRSVWMPYKLNWWIGLIFALGSLLFALASLLCLVPKLAAVCSISSAGINAIFFAGSIPFTTAAYLQLFQAANAGVHPEEDSSPKERFVLIGWRPHDLGWLSCALQFAGTVFFNFNTFDAMLPSLSWVEQDFFIWVPNILGSILFLTSGYLAFGEVCHFYWGWKPKDLSWWAVSINLLGCVAFMASALLAIVLPGDPNEKIATLSLAFTFQGAVCFFIGGLLLLPEAALGLAGNKEPH